MKNFLIIFLSFLIIIPTSMHADGGDFGGGFAAGAFAGAATTAIITSASRDRDPYYSVDREQARMDREDIRRERRERHAQDRRMREEERHRQRAAKHRPEPYTRSHHKTSTKQSEEIKLEQLRTERAQAEAKAAEEKRKLLEAENENMRLKSRKPTRSRVDVRGYVSESD